MHVLGVFPHPGLDILGLLVPNCELSDTMFIVAQRPKFQGHEKILKVKDKVAKEENLLVPKFD